MSSVRLPFIRLRFIVAHIGGCQNYAPFLGPYYNMAPNIERTQKGIIILTTTHIICQRISIPYT